MSLWATFNKQKNWDRKISCSQFYDKMFRIKTVKKGNPIKDKEPINIKI